MARREKTSAGTPATVVASRAGVEFTLHEYDAGAPQGGGYGERVAELLGVDPAQMYKTLVADVEGALVVAVVPVAATLDLKALADALGRKRATMAEPAAAERSTGYVRGGISPLGQRKALPTVVDESALAFQQIYISAGRRGVQMRLAPGDLVMLTSAKVAALARP